MAACFLHINLTGIDPGGVMHNLTHDRVRMKSTTQTGMPILLRILRGEDRRRRIISAVPSTQAASFERVHLVSPVTIHPAPEW